MAASSKDGSSRPGRGGSGCSLHVLDAVIRWTKSSSSGAALVIIVQDVAVGRAGLTGDGHWMVRWAGS